MQKGVRMFIPDPNSIENANTINRALWTSAAPQVAPPDGSRESVLAYLVLFQRAIAKYAQVNSKPPFFLYGNDWGVPLIPQRCDGPINFFTNRDVQPASWPKNAVICEIGTWQGYYAKKIMEQATPSCLHIVDISLKAFDHAYFSRFVEDKRVVLHEGPSGDVIPTFADHSFDVVYFDGDHSYAGVASDIEKMLPKIKVGGLLVFNDYTAYSPLDGVPYGVLNAVNQLLQSDQFEVTALAVNPYGYHDITVKKCRE